jgi:hypothetical protein
MTEDFLHYIWKFRLFNQNQLKTEQGENLVILKTGEHNIDSGPDFFNSKIKLGNTEWAGNIEIHTYSSDWKKHKHQKDAAYSNIILHVVYEDDERIYRNKNSPLPTLVLKPLVQETVIQKYQTFKASNDWIACEKSIHRVPEAIRSLWLERLLIERLEQKSKFILSTLQLNKNNWEETFYYYLASNFGFKINAIPFELLAKSLPYVVIAKHKNSPLQVEALLFGMSGMLEKQVSDKYLRDLQNEFQFLKTKYSLVPIEEHLWKFLRLRPANFPTIRLAQFAALLLKSAHLFSQLLESEDLDTLKKTLQVEVSEYWKTHYTMEKKSIRKNKTLGKSAIENLIANTLIPFLFVYGRYNKLTRFEERAFQFLEKLDAERNTIIEKFENLGIKAVNAMQSQALLQLKNTYCQPKRCLHCTIGNNLLKN